MQNVFANSISKQHNLRSNEMYPVKLHHRTPTSVSSLVLSMVNPTIINNLSRKKLKNTLQFNSNKLPPLFQVNVWIVSVSKIIMIHEQYHFLQTQDLHHHGGNSISKHFYKRNYHSKFRLNIDSKEKKEKFQQIQLLSFQSIIQSSPYEKDSLCL